MKNIVHFEIHAIDPLRAIKFYSDVFSWEITKWAGDDSEYWLIVTGPKEQTGFNGGIIRRSSVMELGSPSGFICTIDVPSIDEYIRIVEEGGGRVVVPKMKIPGKGWIVYCNDTEGNIFGMLESVTEGEMT